MLEFFRISSFTFSGVFLYIGSLVSGLVMMSAGTYSVRLLEILTILLPPLMAGRFIRYRLLTTGWFGSIVLPMLVMLLLLLLTSWVIYGGPEGCKRRFNSMKDNPGIADPVILGRVQEVSVTESQFTDQESIKSAASLLDRRGRALAGGTLLGFLFFAVGILLSCNFQVGTGSLTDLLPLFAGACLGAFVGSRQVSDANLLPRSLAVFFEAMGVFVGSFLVVAGGMYFFERNHETLFSITESALVLGDKACLQKNASPLGLMVWSLLSLFGAIAVRYGLWNKIRKFVN